MPPLQIHEDLAFQSRIYRFQRYGRLLLLLLALAAMVGFFGRGYATGNEFRDPSGALDVHFDRFARVRAPQRMEIDCVPAAGSDKSAGIWFDSSLMRDIQIEAMSPEPSSQAWDSGRFVFDVDGGAGGSRVLLVRFRATSPGLLRGRIGYGTASVPVQQFVYP